MGPAPCDPGPYSDDADRPIPTSRSRTPSQVDHLGRAEVHAALGAGVRVEVQGVGPVLDRDCRAAVVTLSIGSAARRTLGRESSGGRVGVEDQVDSRYPREPVREGLHRAIKDHNRSHAVCRRLGTGRRISQECPAGLRPDGSHHFRTDFSAGGTFEWASGVRLVYNQHFSRSRKGQRHSYSVPLRPDIALSIPDGPNSGLHLFDAKFRVHGLADVGFAGSDKDGDDEKVGERAGSFKRGDIYKMHAYRDAIPDARSVWILYPGGEFRFSCCAGGGVRSGYQVISSPKGLPEEVQGVGAIPVAPVVGDEAAGGLGGAVGGGGLLRETLRRVGGVEGECQLHHTFGNVDITSGLG